MVRRPPGAVKAVRASAAIVAVVALLAASCASGGDERGLSESSASPASTIDDGQQYLDAVTPSNCAHLALSEAFEPFVQEGNLISPEPWSALRETVLPAYRGYADALADLAELLESADWPDDLVDDIDQLAAEARQDASAALAASAATGVDEWSQTLDQFTFDSRTGDTIRGQLGLSRNVALDLDCG